MSKFQSLYKVQNWERFYNSEILFVFRIVMCIWFGKQVYFIRLLWLMLKYLKTRGFVQVDRHWRNLAKECLKMFLRVWGVLKRSHLKSICSNEQLLRAKTEKEKKINKTVAGSSSLRNIFCWGVHWHSVVSFNYPLCDSTIIYELRVLKELWALLANVMAYDEAQLCGRGVCVCANAAVHTLGMFSIWTHQLPKDAELSLKIKH